MNTKRRIVVIKEEIDLMLQRISRLPRDKRSDAAIEKINTGELKNRIVSRGIPDDKFNVMVRCGSPDIITEGKRVREDRQITFSVYLDTGNEEFIQITGTAMM